MREAVASGAPVEVSSLTTETQRVLADPATGGFVAELSAVPARTRQADGTWRAIDLTLVLGADGLVRPVNAAEPMSFSGGGHVSAAAPLASLGSSGKSLGFGWSAPLPAPVLEGPVATYPEVLPGVDLVAKAGVEGYGTYLMVKTAAAATNPALASLKFPVYTSGVTASASADGVQAVDPAGAPVFRGGAFRMWDGKGGPVEKAERSEEGQGARTAQMPTRLSGSDLVVEPDLSVLQDPATVFPVVIDPSVSTSPTQSYWVMVWSNGLEWYNSSTENARVGYDGWSGTPKISRAFYAFNTSVLYTKEVYSAKFAHKLVHSPNSDCSLATYGPGVLVGVTGGISSTTVWPGPSFNAYSAPNAAAHGSSSLCPGYDRVEWDLKSQVQTYAADQSHPTLTIGMRSQDESDRDGWRQFDNDATAKLPTLSVVYFSHPNKPGLPSVDGAYKSSTNDVRTTDTTFTMRSVVSDPDGGQLKARFEFWQGATRKTTITTPTAVASGGTAQITSWDWTNSPTMQLNSPYVVKVWAIDDNGNESLVPSDSITLTVDTTSPIAPTVSSTTPTSVAQSSTYPVTVTHSAETDLGAYCWATSPLGGAWVPGTETCVTKATGSTTTVTVGPFNLSGDYYDVHIFAKDLAGRSGPSIRHTIFVF